jgi:hypothetical protein
VEALEDRTTPTQFGNPWTDPTHLTLSFAPDGTRVLGLPSRAQASLARTMTPAVWQKAILRAVQSWSEVANLSVGLVADGGQAFGATGPAQSDPRFGDIRVGGIPMGMDALAATVPPDPFIVGSLAGDLFINTRATFTYNALYRVALHEVGHALGLAPSSDPASVMFNTFNQNLVLSSSDVAAIRALYGSRPADPNEGSNGNDSIDRATRVREPGSYDGRTPLVAYGDITTRGDVDVFEVRSPSHYQGPITFRLQTTGVSLLAARMVVMDRNGLVLGSTTGTGPRGGVLSLTLNRSDPGEKYYVRVLATPGAFHGVGRFALGITFDRLLRPTATPIGQVLRGPFDSLEADEIEEVFLDPDGGFYDDDGGADDEANAAAGLPPVPGFPDNTRYGITASLAATADADFYSVRAPQTQDNTVVLTATVRAIGPNGSTPRIQVFRVVDEVGPVLEPLETTILANGNGSFTIQAVGVPANTDYVLRIGDATNPGNYALDVSFLTRAAEIQTFSSGTVNNGSYLNSILYVGRSQVFGLALSAIGPAGVTVQLSIVNALGQTVFSMTGATGDTVTSTTVLLPPGQYSLRVATTGPAGAVQFRIDGGVITDPIGPRPANSATAPQYQDPAQPTAFLYPDGTHTTDPFLWLPWFPI